MHPHLLIDIERLESDKEYRDELRHRCQTDLFFLAPFVGFYDFRPDLHGPVKDLYVHKRPGVAIEDQDPIKNRMHLDPRHTYKTSAGIVDQIQWIITCPDVTIANETATQALAKLLTKRVAGTFLKPKTKPATTFQRIFPEFVVEKLRGNYVAPCRTVASVEPTLYSTSIGSSQSGYHPWVLNPDDTADTENSGIDASDQSRDRVWNSYQTNLNTLRHGGYVHIRGTRYHPFDMYGRTLRNMDPSLWKTLIRGSLLVKSGERLVEGEFPAEHEVQLLWPGLLSYGFLKEKFKEYATFMCQQMNDPAGGGVQVFNETLYAQAQVDAMRIPQLGTTRICWRLPCDKKGFMGRYAVGVAMRDLNGRMYVVDAWRGVYTPSELAKRVVDASKRHQTGEITIEKTPGSEYLIPHFHNEAAKRNVSLRIDQPDFESDDTKRKGRCEQLEPMMRAGRLWISDGIAGQKDELRNHFANFGVTEENGFPDVISRLALRIPVSVLRSMATDAQRAARQQREGQAAWDTLYAHGGADVVDHSIVEEMRRRQGTQNSYGLSPLLGGLDG